MAKKIEVDLSEQRVKAYLGDVVVFDFDCVTGDSSHPTTKGTFSVQWKSEKHVSKKYGAKMHYALFFHQGEALHQYHGPVPISVLRSLKQNLTQLIGSHGCVRLSEENAKSLFEWAPVKTRVRVF